MTMLKLRSRRSVQAHASRRRLTCMSPAAFLLLQGVAGSDVAVSKAVDYIDDDRIKQKAEGSSEAALTASESKVGGSSFTHERSLVDQQLSYNNATSTLVSPIAPPTPMPTHPSLKYVGNDWDWGSQRLDECEGDCDEDEDCVGDLICFQRETGSFAPTPGCLPRDDEESGGTDYCIRPDATIVTAPPTTALPTVSPAPTPTPPRLKNVGNDWNWGSYKLGECEGDCDRDGDCEGDLICFQRETGDEYTHTPGCLGGDFDGSETDYCIRPDAKIVTAPPTTASPTVSAMPTPVPAPMPTKNPSGLLDYMKMDREKNLNECEGDCDRNSDCVGDLICYQRKDGGEPLPGCEGTPNSGTDFCIRPEYTYMPTPRPTRRPTPRPTRRPTRTPTASPTFTPVPGGEPAARIKMYWQSGYTWQDSYKEEKYCLQCRRGCLFGHDIQIDDCDKDHRQKFVRVEGDKTIRPAMAPHLCFTHQNRADDIELDVITLEHCNGSERQRFYIVGTPWQKWGKFEIRTSLRSNRQPTCLTNAHHPRRWEKIFPQRCDRARYHQTSSWTLY